MESASSSSKQSFPIAISAITFICIFVFEKFCMESLYAFSLSWIPGIQDGSSDMRKTFWKTWTDIAYKGCILLPIGVSLFIKRDLAQTTYYGFLLTALFFITTFLKIAYHGPRPFWSSDDVQAFTCTTQFGNPSGHSILAFGMSMGIALEFTEGNVEKLQKIGLILGALAFGTSVGYSRMFLGVHSLD